MSKFPDLAEPLSRALSSLGYAEATPIQAQAIPHLLEGQDLLGIAQTGTGKTATFALPALDYIFTEDRDPPKRGARVLVLAPTRELVGQIYDSFVSYGRFMMELTVGKIVGGVSINRQIKSLVRGNDVLVATPGRLIDLLDREAITLKDVEILILDEADQMMDMGFIHALKQIVPLLPEDRQTVLFSATLPPKIKKLAQQFLTDPVQVTVSPPNTTAERVVQSVTFAKKDEKPMLLADHLLQPGVDRALVFTRTKHGADRVVKRLARAGLSALAIHGNKNQNQRTRALNAFKDRTVDILVATDVAARGIDIPGITHVFNYEIPNVPEQYVHRIGRTARANTDGRAIAFVSPDETAYLKDIQKLLGETIPVEPMPEDMAARVKAIQAREPVAVVDTKPETGRQGRGKLRKKQKQKEWMAREEAKHGRGPKKQSRKPSKHDQEGSAQGPSKPRRKSGAPNEDGKTDKPKSSKPNRPRRDKQKTERANSDKLRSERPKTERQQSERTKSDRPQSGAKTQTSGKAPARRDGSGKPSAPKANRRKAPSRKPTGRKTSPRKPHKGGKAGGGNQPVKRRQR